MFIVVIFRKRSGPLYNTTTGRVHYYRKCAILQEVCTITGRVHYYRKCALLQEVCTIAGCVHYYRKCALLQEVCNITGSVHYCRMCALLQEVCTITGSVQYYRKCALLQEVCTDMLRKRVDNEVTVTYLIHVAHKWLLLRLDCLCILTMTFISIFCVLNRASLDVGTVGLVMNTSFQVLNYLSTLSGRQICRKLRFVHISRA